MSMEATKFDEPRFSTSLKLDLKLDEQFDPLVQSESGQSNRLEITTSSSGSCPGLGHGSLVPLPIATSGPIQWSSGRLIISATLSKSYPIMGQDS